MKIPVPLTDARIKSFKPGDKPYKKADGQGLYIEVLPNGTRRWWARYKIKGAAGPTQMALGRYPEVSLRDAREAARAAVASAREGLNPSSRAKRREAAGAKTLRQVAEDWAARFLAPGRLCERSRKGKAGYLAHILPKLGDMPIAQIEPPILLAEVLRPIEAAGHLETAHRVRAMCGEIWRFAIACGWATRDIAQDLRGAIPAPKTKHRAAITDPAQVGRLLVDIENYHGMAIVRHALMLAPLVFLRPGELRQLEWAWVDWQAKRITIPAAMMKMRADHIVPLARQALEVLRSMHDISGQGRYVFPGQRLNGRPMSDAAINAALGYLGYSSDVMTAHGFRGMASTLLNEAGYNRDYVERQLAHSERDAVRDAYNHAQYLPQRAAMMQEWADFLDKLKEVTRKRRAA